MSPPPSAGLPEALERAATALPADAAAIRPANGDPARLAAQLDLEAAVRVLGWLLAHEPEAGGELAEAWAEDPERGAAALLRLRGEDLPKAGRKALRRAHHQLRSRGFEVAEASEGVVRRLPAVGDALDQALVSPFDATGTRMVYLLQSHPSGGARVLEIMLDEMRGVVEFEVYTTGRSTARRFARDFTRRSRFPGVQAPAAAVRALVTRVAARQAADRPLPRGFAEWRARLAAGSEGQATPGELARQGLGSPPATPEAVARAAERVRGREIGPWPPPADRLQALADRLEEIAKSPIVVSGSRRRERVQEVLAEAQAELCVGGFGELTAERLEESAWLAWQRGQEPEARDLLAAAQGLRGGDAAASPFLRAILEVVLSPVLARIEPEPGSDPDSLLVRPKR